METLKGIAASKGVALGPAYIYRPVICGPSRPAQAPADAETELGRLAEAIDASRQQLQDIYESAVREIGEEAAAIFQAHQAFLDDPMLLDSIRERIQKGEDAETAVRGAFAAFAAQFDAMEDPYFRERAADLRDVGERVLRNLCGAETSSSLTRLDRNVIVVAQDLTPSDTAQMDKAHVLGFATARGGETSHTAIIARILGIPAVVGIGDGIMNVGPGQELILDGEQGLVVVAPDQSTREEYERQRAYLAAQCALEMKAAQEPAVTLDGHRVEVVANIADVGSACEALEYGAEGVGLFRTEFLYLDRTCMPDEEEQYAAYRAVADAMGDRPLIIRTLDIGGDKQLPYLDIGQEMNPFLGYRAIRLSLGTPDLFAAQLRAILRAAYERNVKVMFPMVATVEEVHAAKEALAQAQAELAARKCPFATQMEVGIMVEIPAAAIAADILAPEVDFFSIGTNDLVQYTLAVDRVNEKVSYLYQPLHPAILRLIDHVIRAAHAEGKWVGMCGEMAGDLLAIPILLGLGLDEFSMNASVIPAAKALIRRLKVEEMRHLAQECLKCKTADEVHAWVVEVVGEKPAG
ncbi:MAG: phosphoenolpyruvate--protein phosphotransferase [Chloroflexi bacterium]|nr:phosphoenolpyruvate--protein phosphotransferase [Chloroflexota bacterium]